MAVLNQLPDNEGKPVANQVLRFQFPQRHSIEFTLFGLFARKPDAYGETPLDPLHGHFWTSDMEADGIAQLYGCFAHGFQALLRPLPYLEDRPAAD